MVTAAAAAKRHSHILAAWQLAQRSPHTLRAYSRTLGDRSWLDDGGMDLLTVKRPKGDADHSNTSGMTKDKGRALLAEGTGLRWPLRPRRWRH